MLKLSIGRRSNFSIINRNLSAFRRLTAKYKNEHMNHEMKKKKPKQTVKVKQPVQWLLQWTMNEHFASIARAKK